MSWNLFDVNDFDADIYVYNIENVIQDCLKVINKAKNVPLKEDTFCFVRSDKKEKTIRTFSSNFYQNVIPEKYIDYVFPDGFELIVLPDSSITYVYEPNTLKIGLIDYSVCLNVQLFTLIGNFLVCGKKLENGFQSLRTFELFEFLVSVKGINGYSQIDVSTSLPTCIFED